MIQYYTYIYSHPITKEPFYVGKGCNDRSHSHLKGRTKRDNLHLYNFIQKMIRENNTPIIEIINVTCENTALRLEQFLINQYGRKDLGTGTLLNLTDGGENPPHPSGKDHPMFGRSRLPNSGSFKSGKDHVGYGKPGCWRGVKKEDHPMFGKPGTNLGKFGKDHPRFGLHHTHEIITCPHCNKCGGVSAMKRWHFDNCKLRSK